MFWSPGGFPGTHRVFFPEFLSDLSVGVRLFTDRVQVTVLGGRGGPPRLGLWKTTVLAGGGGQGTQHQDCGFPSNLPFLFSECAISGQMVQEYFAGGVMGCQDGWGGWGGWGGARCTSGWSGKGGSGNEAGGWGGASPQINRWRYKLDALEAYRASQWGTWVRI